MTEQQRRILAELRHGPLNQMDIAVSIMAAPFTVRGDLRALRRDRIVRERFTRDGHVWELTNQGHAIAWQADQLAL
jgi:predicted transcriptional regulator